jgi:hypothetical protein
MKKSLLSALTAVALLSGASIAAAETTTTRTTTWTDEQGTVIREYSTTKRYAPFNDPKLEANVGVELPSNVTLYALPETIKIQEPERYSYVIINDRPVVVEKSTRRVIHTWK